MKSISYPFSINIINVYNMNISPFFFYNFLISNMFHIINNKSLYLYQFIFFTRYYNIQIILYLIFKWNIISIFLRILINFLLYQSCLSHYLYHARYPEFLFFFLSIHFFIYITMIYYIFIKFKRLNIIYNKIIFFILNIYN